MKLEREEEVLQKALDLENKQLAMRLFNYQAEMKNTKNEMTNALDLLDEVANGSEQAKQKLRKKILDTYNDLPRNSLDLINDILENL